jgi:HB1, ASXL, restriction endonuclease HTH domain
MNTLAVVEEVLREVAAPVTVKQIVKLAAGRLPSRSRTPDTVVARDLSMDIKRLGESSRFVRTAPGLYALRVVQSAPAEGPSASVASDAAPTNILSVALRNDRASTIPHPSVASSAKSASSDQVG